LIKDEYEIAALRRAAEISAKSLNEVLKTARPGMNDLEIAGLMEYVWKKEGSPRSSFGIIVSSGDSAVSLYTLKSENYNSTDRIMREGELLFIDYGAAEWKTYTSDICRTYPVSGRFTPEQKKYYEMVNDALDAALEKIKPGVMMLEVVKAAARVFHEHGLEQYEDIERMGAERVWGIMPSPTQYILREKTLSTDYSGARGTGVRDLGHHIGLEALDSRDYSMPLSPGMVFTVEPKLYIPEKGIAIMIEEMVLVTEAGYENLSSDTPRSVDAIEKAMAER
jgi:Xaa-Pro aminopeptidase